MYPHQQKNHHRRERDSSSDEEPASSSARPVIQKSNTAVKPKSINEMLQIALGKASEPGLGDEMPEVLEAPGGEDINGIDREKSAEIAAAAIAKAKEILIAKQIAIEEEERKVTEMTFNLDTLQPIDNMVERAKYIPLRLTYEERKSLRLVAATISVSDYTNNVDQVFKNPARRPHVQLQSIVSFVSGLIASLEYARGQDLVSDRNLTPHESTLQSLLEIARRYKICNPEKMRSEYGKLVYLMQDADSSEVKQLLGIEIKKPIRTVYDVLAAANALQILEDKRLPIATEEILPDKLKSRATIQLEIRRKEKAAESLVKQYASRQLPEETLRSCLYAITDNNSFLNSNLRPIQDCIVLLKHYFSSDKAEPKYSLAIAAGSTGARLTHSHDMQFNYVLQSLTLWSIIVQDMFRLWYLAELDLLDDSTTYTLKNTGQGLQRVKTSPRVYRAMHEILARTKAQLGGWVGSSVIHLGDDNVPNALMFIDKYTQVPRILTPLIKTLENIETACEENEGLTRYMRAYGGIDKAKKDILHDFFTHAFDGSGGDNFFDAGSCIDGRLTSAWHWCSQLANKPYYPLFRLTGFLSFDGQFDN